jgi:hypothetical protein
MRNDFAVMSRRRKRAIRAELVRLLALVAALAVVTGAWLAGQRYFYCAPMQRVALDECCAGHGQHDGEADAHAAGAVATQTPKKCCDARTFDQGDRGASAAPPAVTPPMLLAVVAVLALPGLVDAPARARATHESRAGPPPAGPLSWRTEIDVSLS